jgi:hypothetical protein
VPDHSHHVGKPRQRSGRLGAAFEVIELDSGPGNPTGFGRAAHSVLTRELREEPGHPTFAVRERVVAFLRRQLGAGETE